MLEERSADDPLEALSFVAHEMRTPLTALIQALQVLDGARAGRLSEDQSRFVRMGLKNAEALLSLTHRIQDLARWQAGGARVTFEPFDSTLMARFVVDSLTPLAETRGIELRIDAALQAPRGWGDPELVRDLLFNLLGNALKFTPREGSVTVRVRGDETSGLLYEVEDTGPGVPEGEEERIFERFYQAGDARRGREGLGLGLAITREIAHAHGGTVRARNAEGGGAIFTLLLPALGSGATAESHVRRTLDEAHGEPLTLLALSPEGLDPADAHEAIKSWEAGPSDLSVVDLGEGRLGLLWKSARDGRHPACIAGALATAGLPATAGWCTHPEGAGDERELVLRARIALENALRANAGHATA